MTRNVHLVKEWKDIEVFLTESDWPRRWMEKYSEGLTSLVMSVAEKAKQDGRMKPVRSIVSKNLPTATKLQGAATELQDTTATELQGVATSNLDSPNSPVQESLDCDPMTPSISQVWETIVMPQPRRKR